MEGHKNLRDEINQLIMREKDMLPPSFSYEELIAMCLALHDDPMTPRAVMAWVTDTFAEYDEIAFRYFWTKLSGNYDDGHEEEEGENFMNGFLSTFEKFEFLVKTKYEDRGPEIFSYSASTADVRRVLKLRPFKDSEGTFPILDLPAEIRTRIYKMALSYPQTGVLPAAAFRSCPHKTAFSAVTRDYSQPFSFKRWSEAEANQEESQHLDLSATTLSLLSANKQVYIEAMPCFYEINTFYLGSLLHALKALRMLPLERSLHLRHLAFEYQIADRVRARTFFNMVCALPNLRELDINMQQVDWFNTLRSDQEDLFTASIIPGFDLLANVGRNIKTNFSGECVDIAAYWKPKIETQATVQTETSEEGEERSDDDKQPARLVE